MFWYLYISSNYISLLWSTIVVKDRYLIQNISIPLWWYSSLLVSISKIKIRIILCFTLMHKNKYGNNCFSYPFLFQILLWKFLVKVVWIIQNTQQSVLNGPGKNQFLNATKTVVLWGTTVVNLVLQVNFHFSFFYTVIYDIHHFWSSLSQFFFGSFYLKYSTCLVRSQPTQ